MALFCIADENCRLASKDCVQVAFRTAGVTDEDWIDYIQQVNFWDV
jgi:hypothetical protein